MSVARLHGSAIPFRQTQRGLTMVELLVALTLSLLIALAAIASLTVARQGFTSVDGISQLKDNARFSSDLITRLVMQSGFKDVNFASNTRTSQFQVKAVNPNPPPFISGFNNSLIKTDASNSASNPLANIVARTASAGGCASTSDPTCVNGSDILVVRYQSSALVPGGSVSDNTMLNCGGKPDQAGPTAVDEQLVSIFHVARSDSGEPALMCTARRKTLNPADPTDTVDETDPLFSWTAPLPIVQGVEGFQVLYGVDGVSPNVVASGPTDTAPEAFLRADQMTVSGNAQATNDNWRRVRSLRVGLVLRAARGTSQDRDTQTFFPLGLLNRSADAGSTLTFTGGNPAVNATNYIFPADGRLRESVTFTVHLRNTQGQ